MHGAEFSYTARSQATSPCHVKTRTSTASNTPSAQTVKTKMSHTSARGTRTARPPGGASGHPTNRSKRRAPEPLAWAVKITWKHGKRCKRLHRRRHDLQQPGNDQEQVKQSSCRLLGIGAARRQLRLAQDSIAETLHSKNSVGSKRRGIKFRMIYQHLLGIGA